MDLYDAVSSGKPKAITAALGKGEKPSIAELEEAIDKPLAVMELLLPKTPRAVLGKKGPQTGDLLLTTLGFAIRTAYSDAPKDVRLKRSKDKNAPEPKKVVELRQKAELLRKAGAPLDFAAAAMIGYVDETRSMLEKDPKLAKRKVWDQDISDLAAWSGAWDTSKLIREVRKGGGKPFDWNKMTKGIHAWAKKALGKASKQLGKETLRRIAFDVDGPQILLAADVASGKGKMPGAYSHGELASFEEAEELSTTLATQFESGGERGHVEATKKTLEALVQVADMLEADKTLKLRRSPDFLVLVFDHDEDEKAAMKRRKKK